MHTQSTSAVFMVRPTSFGFNEQTAQTNTFQHHLTLDAATVKAQAIAEFDTMVQKLRDHDIAVTVFEDTDPRPKPDAVFPNNWFSAWPNGDVYLYPMATESRRIERTSAALDTLDKSFVVNAVRDISATELHGENLESTGVMIFDHRNRIVYGCISPRCNEKLFTKHAQALGYEPVTFHAFGADGTAVYHTNVMMGITDTTAVICDEAITDTSEREMVLQKLQATGHDIVSISQEQMAAFCGNILELSNPAGEHFVAMSQTAYDAFTPAQRAQLSFDKTLLPCSVPTIETIGGGSVRCMLGEIFLPRR